MKKNYSFLVMFLIVIFVLTGCISSGSKGISEMTPTEKSVWMVGLYNSQYTDYMITTGYARNIDGQWVKQTTPELSEDTRKTLRNKKNIMIQVQPLIRLYVGGVNAGNVPGDRITEQQIILLLTQLSQ